MVTSKEGHVHLHDRWPAPSVSTKASDSRPEPWSSRQGRGYGGRPTRQTGLKGIGRVVPASASQVVLHNTTSTGAPATSNAAHLATTLQQQAVHIEARGHPRVTTPRSRVLGSYTNVWIV